MRALAALAIFVFSVSPTASARANDPPFAIAPQLFASDAPNLGLPPAPGAATFTIFRPDDRGNRYNNGAVLIAFRGRLYAQWQSSDRDEDAPDTRVLFSSSEDGEHWSAPAALVPRGFGAAWHSSGGWWTDGDTLVAYVNVWPHHLPAGGRTEYLTSRDGAHWTPPLPVLDRDGPPVAGIIEQDPHALPGGRIVTAFHLSPGLTATPCYTDDPLGVRGWTRGQLPHLPASGAQSRELEPSSFLRGDGTLVMVFRDQASSFRVLAAESSDRGEHWTSPVVTTMPDARSKQSAGNLPDGSAFLVNCPSGTRERIPLVLTLSRDGHRFDRAFLLRGTADLPPLRFPGKFKRPGYHYPKSIVWSGRLWVAYATNKEDVQVTAIPLARLAD